MRPPGTAREGEGAAVGVVGEVPGAVIHAHLQVGFLGHPLQAARRCRAPRHFWLHGREAVVVEGDGERLVAQLVAASGERRAGGPCEIIPPRPRSPGDARIILPGRRGHRYTRMAKVCWPTARTRSKSSKCEISHTKRINPKGLYSSSDAALFVLCMYLCWTHRFSSYTI